MKLRNWYYASVIAALLTASLLFAASAPAEISYRVHALPESKQVAVEVAIPNATAETVVQIPRWLPGFYGLRDYGRSIKDFAANGADSRAVTVDVVDDHTWKIHAAGSKTVTVSYKAPLEFQNGMGHYSGAATYIYVVGRTQQPCRLHLDLPKDWKIAVGLDGKGADYTAETYDVLADNSVTLGNYIEDTYTAAGKPHTIAVRGAGASQIDMALLRQECEFVSNMETDFMGGAPYHKYVWHFNVNPGRGGGSGIEHLSSTEITIASEITPRTTGLFSHEFFHLWNVKRIRSRVLGPFDYTQLPKTGALWWLEGVTEYFGASLLGRYGWTNEKDWYAAIAGTVSRQRAQPARLNVSPYDSSFRVGETNGGRGNSNGFGLSYYDDGFIVGLCLDLELLGKTQGKRSLDDVEFSLWRMCRNNQPGFDEGEIRKQLIAVGGDTFGPLYDRLVLAPGDLPVEAALAHVGLELGDRTETRADVGFLSEPSVEKSGMEITGAKNSEIELALPKGTIIRAINGHKIEGASAMALRRSFTNAIAGIAVGGELKLQVLLPGKDQASDVSIKAISVLFTVSEVRSVASPTPDQLRLRAIWLAKRRS